MYSASGGTVYYIGTAKNVKTFLKDFFLRIWHLLRPSSNSSPALLRLSAMISHDFTSLFNKTCERSEDEWNQNPSQQYVHTHIVS